MVQPISTKKLNGPSTIEKFGEGTEPGAIELELPDPNNFAPQFLRTDPESFIAFCKDLLPKLIASPGFWERRNADRCLAEFHLLEPNRTPITYPAKFIDELLQR